MDFFKTEAGVHRQNIKNEIKEIDQAVCEIARKKRRILDLYASEQFPRAEYIKKSLAYDEETNKLKMRKAELLDRVPLLNETAVIDQSIREYCEGARSRYEKCVDFDTTRQFLLDYVEKIVFLNDAVALYGSVPVRVRAGDGATRVNWLRFCIDRNINRKETLTKLRLNRGNAEVKAPSAGGDYPAFLASQYILSPEN
jgi:hypothetical protein